MSKEALQLKSAIQSLNIKKPYDLRAQMKPTLKAPAQPEQTQKEDAPPEMVPANGFFMLAHSVFQVDVIRDISGDAFRIFIWMSAQAWRFKNSNGEFRAAVDYVSQNCGCSRSTVTRGLSDLKSKKLIECVEQNFKLGNLWRVSRIADGRKDAEDEDAQTESTQNKNAQNEGEVCSKREGSISKLNIEHAQNEQQIINSNNFKNTQHSMETNDAIEKYLKSLIAPKKRESEEFALSELLRNLERRVVLEAFCYLESKKFKFKENQIHSPLQFLTHAIGEVMKVSGSVRTPAVAVAFQTKPPQDPSARKRDHEEMWIAFRGAFKSLEEQNREIANRLQGSQFSVQDEFARNLAVMKWWDVSSR